MNLRPDYLHDEQRFQRAKAAAKTALQGMLYDISDYLSNVVEIEGGVYVDSRVSNDQHGDPIINDKQKEALNKGIITSITDTVITDFMLSVMNFRAAGVESKESEKWELVVALSKIKNSYMRDAEIGNEQLSSIYEAFQQVTRGAINKAMESYNDELDCLLDEYKAEQKRNRKYGLQ